MKEIAVVYMVAGISSRFGGKIKQLAKIGPKGETLIQYSLDQAISSGFNKIIFIVGNKTEKPFKEIFGDQYKNIPIEYALQTYNPLKRNRPWGTLDALCSAKHLINCPFVVCSGDDIYGEKAFKTLFKHLQNNSTSATVGYKLKNVLSKTGTVNRGIIKVNSNNNVEQIKETFNINKSNLNEKNLTEESLCSMLFFAFQPEILEEFNQILKKFKNENENDKEIEALHSNETGKLIQQGKLIMKCYPTEEKWFGVTNPEDEQIIKEQLKNI